MNGRMACPLYRPKSAGGRLHAACGAGTLSAGPIIGGMMATPFCVRCKELPLLTIPGRCSRADSRPRRMKLPQNSSVVGTEVGSCPWHGRGV
jgi:hypothetical protein